MVIAHTVATLGVSVGFTQQVALAYFRVTSDASMFRDDELRWKHDSPPPKTGQKMEWSKNCSNGPTENRSASITSTPSFDHFIF